MSFYSTLLDGIVARTSTPPPMVATLKLPPLKRWERGRTWAEWKVDPAVFHERGAVFGGYLAALADSALALASMTVLEEGEQISTSDLRVSYYRPVTEGTLQIEGTVLHRGRRQISVEVEFKRDDGKIVAKATATQVII